MSSHRSWHHDDEGTRSRPGESFTIGVIGGRPQQQSSPGPGPAPRPVPPPTPRTAAFGKPRGERTPEPVPGYSHDPAAYRRDPGHGSDSSRYHSHSDSAERTGLRGPVPNLPAKLIECPGELALYMPKLECGLIKLTGQDADYCFFTAVQVFGGLQPHLDLGAPVCVNARLVQAAAPVPYLAASLWDQGERMDRAAMDCLLAPAMPDHLEFYYRLSEELLLELEEQDTLARKRTLSQSPEKSAAQPDNKRMRSEESCSSAPGVEEEWGGAGVAGTVSRFLSDKVGEVMVRVTRPVKVIFHASQVWCGGDAGEMYSPFLEIYPSSELPFFLTVGQEVRLNARRVTGSKYDYQATVVWVGDEVPPVQYRSEELLQNLNLTLSQNIFLETGDTKHQVNPLLGTPDTAVPARVAEYLSAEVGLLRLEHGSRAAVLFHLNQVWTGGGAAQPLASCISRLAAQLLPPGTPVMVNMRPLPASQGSKLKYQATCLWPFMSDGPQSDELLPQYMPYDERVSLVEELDSHHDNVKKLLKLHESPFSEQFLPVQAVLMGLPNYWQAQVVAAVNDDFGIIKISPKRGGELTTGVRSLLVMFHIEDVFDSSGLPAVQSSTVTMSAVLDSFVDVSARPICYDCEPESILDLQQRLSSRDAAAETFQDRSGKIPLLQAIFVCVKNNPEASSVMTHVPKPTPFRNHPGNFSMGTTQFYFNPLLKLRLNIKLVHYFAAVGAQPPYKTKLKEFPTESDEVKIIEETKKLDVNNVQRFLYGEFPNQVEPLAQDITATLPKIIDRVPVRPVFLHRSKLKSECGIIQVELLPGRSNKLRGPVTVLGFCHLSRYRFFMKKDCFADDLANILPVHSEENYFANIELSFPGSAVPYLVLDIWNENLRQDLGAHSPVSDSVQGNKEFIEECARNIAGFTNMSVEILMRSNKRETMTRERSGEGVRRPPDEDRSLEPRAKVRRRESNDGNDTVDREANERRLGEKGKRDGRKAMFEEVPAEQMSSPRDDGYPPGERGQPLVPPRPVINIDNFNPKSLNEQNLDGAKFYIARSFNVEDVLVSIQQGVWCGSNEQTNRKLNHGYKENRANNAPVYLFFGVIGSGRFCGVAEMTSFVDFKARSNIWFSNKNKQQGRFKVRWVYVKDVPNGKLNHITLENNDNKTIAFTRDGHDVPHERGVEALEFIHSYEHSSTVLDDTDKLAEVLARAEAGGRPDRRRSDILPRPFRGNLRVEKKLMMHNFLHDHYGQVLKIMDENYGILAGFTMFWVGKNKREFVPFQVIFDAFDVFIGEKDLTQLGRKLGGTLKVGDLVRFNAVRLEKPSESEGEQRDIRHLATGIITADTPDKLKKLKFPYDLDHVVSMDQIFPEKIENWKKVAAIMNGVRVKKSEQKLLDEIKSGILASKMMNIPANDQIFQTHGEVSKAKKGKKDAKHSPPEDTVDYKDLDKLVEQLKPKELRKLLMAYIEAVSSLPEDAARRSVNIAAVTANINTDKDSAFFEDFFVSLGQNCKKAEKAIKVGHVLVTMMQIKTIRSRGVLTKDDISSGPIPEKSTSKADAPAKAKVKQTGNDANKQMNIETFNSCEKNPEENISNVTPSEDIVMLDDEDDFTPTTSKDTMVNREQSLLGDSKSTEESSKSESLEKSSTDSTVISDNNKSDQSKKEESTEVNKDQKEASAESVLSKYSSQQLRTFLKHFIKMIDSDSKQTMSDVSSETKLPEEEVKVIAAEVTARCRDNPLVDGKRQSFKLQNIFLNSTWVGKIVNFNYQ